MDGINNITFKTDLFMWHSWLLEPEGTKGPAGHLEKGRAPQDTRHYSKAYQTRMLFTKEGWNGVGKSLKGLAVCQCICVCWQQ
jgi:hypothetical protein